MADIKLKNTANTEFSISHNGTRGAKSVTSDQIVVAVETIEDFPTNPETGDTVIVKDQSRGGTFIYDATQSAVNNSGTIFNGWVRQYSGSVNVKWFGFKGDNTDETTLLNNILSLGLELEFDKNLQTKVSSTLNMFAGCNFNYLTINLQEGVAKAISKNMAGNVSNIIIDCSLSTVVSNAILFDIDYDIVGTEYYSNITINNVVSTVGNSNAILFYRSSDSTATKGIVSIDNIEINDVTAMAGSVAKGLYVSWNNSADKTDIYINNCRVRNVTPSIEGDAIHITNTSLYQLTNQSCKAEISNCTVETNVPMKRAYKIQYNNTIVRNCISKSTAKVDVAFNSLAFGTIFDNCSVIDSGGGIAFGLEYHAQKINDCTVEASLCSEMLIRVFGSNDAILDKLVIRYSGTMASDYIALIKIFNNCSNLRITNSTLYGALSTLGCAIYLGGNSGATGDIFIENTFIDCRTKICIRATLYTGNIYINNIKNIYDNFFVYLQTETTSTITINSSYINGAISAASSKVTINNSSFVTALPTCIQAGGYSDIKDCSIINNPASKTGAGIAIGSNSKVMQCEIVGFNYAIDDRFNTGMQLLYNAYNNCTSQTYPANAYLLNVGSYAY